MKNIFFVIVVLAVLAQALHTQAYGKSNKLKAIKKSYKKLRPSARGTVAKRSTNPPKVQLPKIFTKKPSVGSNIGISPGQCFKHFGNGAIITVGLGTQSGPNQFIIGSSCPTCNDGDMVPVNSFDQDTIPGYSTLTAACDNWGNTASGSAYKICEALDASGCTTDPITGALSCQGQTQCECKFNNIQESHVDVHGNKVTYKATCSPTTGYQYAVYIKPFGADSPTAPVTVTITNDAQVVNAPGSGIGGNSGNGVSGNNFGGGGNPLSGRRRRRLLQVMTDS
jgi:hypothetical protein